MSIDILSYTANKEVTYLCTNESGFRTTLNATYACVDQNTATCVSCWRKMDSDVKPLNDFSNIICVFNGSNFVGGGSCSWVVPTGVCKARFELWGPGAAGSVGSCCGGGPWGTNGTFMAFTIPVTPGCTYSLCAGSSNNFCAYCCGCPAYAAACCNGTLNPTYITGYGLCSICAPGGCNDLVQNMCARLCRIGFSIQGGQGAAPTPTRFVNECIYKLSPNACGPTICQCYTLCNASAHAPLSMTPVADWNIWPCGCITIGLCSYHPIYRIPSIHNGMFLDGNYYGYYTHMVTYPKCGWQLPANCGNMGCGQFLEYNATSNACTPCDMSFNSHCCCYNIPGLGGAFVHSIGGCTAQYGDRGRGGFVKVIYSCCGGNGNFQCAN